MIEIIKAFLIVDIIMLAILFACVIAMGIWHFKKDKKHKQEKARLEQSRDYHIKELQKKIGIQNDTNGFDLGERGKKR